MNIVIIEDEFFVAKHLKELIEGKGYVCKGIFRSGDRFINETDWDFDVAMVDILLSTEFTGLQVAEELNKHNKPFVFLTANKDMRTLESAARLSPKTYLTKPFNPNDVLAALEAIKYQLPALIEIQDVHGKRTINPTDIVFVTSDRSYVEIQTLKEKIVQRKLLKELEEELPDSFIRVHRSYVINRNFIESKSGSDVMVGGYKIPVSRNYKDALE